MNKHNLEQYDKAGTYHNHFNGDRHWKLFLKFGVELFYKHYHNDGQHCSDQVNHVGLLDVLKYVTDSLTRNNKCKLTQQNSFSLNE